MDLSSKTSAELSELSALVEQEIKSRSRLAIQSAREQILAIAKSANISIGSLLELSEASGSMSSTKRAKRKSGPVAVQYVDPTDSNRCWTGRGRMPLWLKNAIEGEGKSLAAFKVKESADSAGIVA